MLQRFKGPKYPSRGSFLDVWIHWIALAYLVRYLKVTICLILPLSLRVLFEEIQHVLVDCDVLELQVLAELPVRRQDVLVRPRVQQHLQYLQVALWK